jgi:hypothetical protein
MLRTCHTSHINGKTLIKEKCGPAASCLVMHYIIYIILQTTRSINYCFVDLVVQNYCTANTKL